MMKRQPNKQLNFKEKTRIYSNSNDALMRNVLGTDSDDIAINEVISTIFKDELKIDKTEFLLLLNNVIGFVNSFFPSITMLSPGKTDEKLLFEELEKSLSNATNDLHILLNRYGHQTYQYLPIFDSGWKPTDTYKYLNDAQKMLENITRSIPLALDKLKNTKGKNRGNNSKGGIPNLIFQLVRVYEIATGLKASENFHHGKHSSLGFKGQFYEFVIAIFKLIDKKYCEQSGSDKNPFKTNLDDSSLSLGKYIEKVFRNMKKMPTEQT